MLVRLERPKLTFTPEVATRVRHEYARADTILEYGSGGSTVMAAEMGGKTLFSVETDPVWGNDIRAYLDAVHPEADIHMHHADIGPTKEWGLPEHYSKLNALKYLRYSRSVWDRPDFKHPDLILIDGRFRIGCFYTCLSRITQPTRILVDDFADRPFLRNNIQRLMHPAQVVGRMGLFDVQPRRVGWSLQRLRMELCP